LFYGFLKVFGQVIDKSLKTNWDRKRPNYLAEKMDITKIEDLKSYYLHFKLYLYVEACQDSSCEADFVKELLECLEMEVEHAKLVYQVPKVK